MWFERAVNVRTLKVGKNVQVFFDNFNGNVWMLGGLKTIDVIFSSVASKLEGISFLTYNIMPSPLLSWSNRWGVLNPSTTKLPTGKLLSIFVSETIKTSILPFTWVERNSNLFLMEFMFIWAKIRLSELSLHNAFKTLSQSFACVTLDTWDLHFSRLIFVILFSCQLKMWDSCLINVSFNSLDPFLFKWSLPLFKWLDLNIFGLSIRYRFLSSQRSFKCKLTSLPFWFKRGCLFLVRY